MRWQPNRLRVWHEMLMDYILLHPRATRAEIGAAFDVSEQMVTNITTSDLFRYQLEQRRAKMAQEVDQTALDRLKNGVQRLAEVGIESLTAAVVEGKADLDGIRDTTEMALKALGYGQSGSGVRPDVRQTTVVVLDKDLLADARAAMRGARPALTLEHDALAPSAA
jgi:hypothetical protein